MPGYSPALAIVTGVLEVAGGVWALAGPGRKAVLRPVAVILFLLAGYQFSEVLVCAHPGTPVFSRLAYLIITWLPPTALVLAVVCAERGRKTLRAVAVFYAAAAVALCIWILAAAGVITRSVCELVIARYFVARPFDVAYALYYQSSLLWIVFGAGLAMAGAGDAVARKHLASLQLGVLGFMAPALAVRILYDGPGDLLPSVMCHFALVLAVSLFGLVLREQNRARGLRRTGQASSGSSGESHEETDP
jgi:hypothetical protein